MQILDTGGPEADARVDVAIVGGGPGGLTAALYLARFRRTVALIDANQSRAAKIARSHNVPGFPEGIAGATLLASLRSQLAPYPVRTVMATVERVEREADGFRVRWGSGDVRARLLLLATGVTDIAPAMPHLLEALRTGALRYCPVCDGYEVIDRAVGVFADGPAGVAEAVYLRHFSADVVLFMEGGARALAPAERERLAGAGIACPEEPVRSIRHWNDRVTVVHGERETRRDALYCALGVDVHAHLARALGATTREGGYVAVDAHHASDVDGLYAIGDVAQGLNQIAVAAGGAAVAASAMHRRLGTRGMPVAPAGHPRPGAAP